MTSDISFRIRASAIFRVRPSRLPGVRIGPSLRVTVRLRTRHWPYQALRFSKTLPVPYRRLRATGWTWHGRPLRRHVPLYTPTPRLRRLPRSDVFRRFARIAQTVATCWPAAPDDVYAPARPRRFPPPSDSACALAAAQLPSTLVTTLADGQSPSLQPLERVAAATARVGRDQS